MDEVRITVEKPLTGKFVRKVARSRSAKKIGVADATAEKASLKQSQKKAANPGTQHLKKSPVETKLVMGRSRTGLESEVPAKQTTNTSGAGGITVPVKKRVTNKRTGSVVKAVRPSIGKQTKSKAESRPKKEVRRGIRLKISDTDGMES